MHHTLFIDSVSPDPVSLEAAQSCWDGAAAGASIWKADEVGAQFWTEKECNVHLQCAMFDCPCSGTRQKLDVQPGHFMSSL